MGSAPRWLLPTRQCVVIARCAWAERAGLSRGWIGPIFDKTGYHMVYDVISCTEPRCVMRVFKDAAKAKEAEKDVQLLMGWPGHKVG